MGKLLNRPICPSCSRIMDGFAPVRGVVKEEGTPKYGDVSICFYCYNFLEYTEGTDGFQMRLLDTRKISSDLLAELIKAREFLRKNKEPRE